MRFFPEPFLTSPDGVLTTGCNLGQAAGAPGCAVDEVCVPTDPMTPEVGVCARREWEKRACVQNCGGNGDCRSGYVCRKTGERGTVALTLTPGGKPGYCAPAPPVPMQ